MRGKGATPLPLPLEKGWPSLFTGSQCTIPLLFAFAKQCAPASARRRAFDVAEINSCEWVNNDFPGGDQAPSSAPIHPQVPSRERGNTGKLGNAPMCPPKPQGAGEGYGAIRKLLTHRRESLGTGVVGEIGKVFRKKRCGLQKGVVVVQIKRIIWGMEKKREKFTLELQVFVISSHLPVPL